MRMKVIFILQIIVISISYGQNTRKMVFPDLDQYKTLKCDLHIHTVFSDGLVWPTIRVDEAVKDGLDAISLTEHIEYQPWKKDIPHPDRNRSYALAKEYAKPYDLLIIHGTEITRKLPPGHANALFVNDVNLIKKDSAIDSYVEAVKQGAFIFWNHPNWIAQKKDGLVELTDFHKMLIKKGLLHGIEVVNDLNFSAEALRVAQQNKLTVLGTSDIHGLIDYQFKVDMGGHRPITLVFAKEKTEEAMKEALFAGRTVTWFDHLLAGNSELLDSLIAKCIVAKNKDYIGSSTVREIELTNTSSCKFLLKNISSFTFHTGGDIVELAPNSSLIIQLKEKSSTIDNEKIVFEVLNTVKRYKEHAKYTIDPKNLR
jgi:hypothetical protein